MRRTEGAGGQAFITRGWLERQAAYLDVFWSRPEFSGGGASPDDMVEAVLLSQDESPGLVCVLGPGVIRAGLP